MSKLNMNNSANAIAYYKSKYTHSQDSYNISATPDLNNIINGFKEVHLNISINSLWTNIEESHAKHLKKKDHKDIIKNDDRIKWQELKVLAYLLSDKYYWKMSNQNRNICMTHEITSTVLNIINDLYKENKDLNSITLKLIRSISEHVIYKFNNNISLNTLECMLNSLDKVLINIDIDVNSNDNQAKDNLIILFSSIKSINQYYIKMLFVWFTNIERYKSDEIINIMIPILNDISNRLNLSFDNNFLTEHNSYDIDLNICLDQIRYYQKSSSKEEMYFSERYPTGYTNFDCQFAKDNIILNKANKSIDEYEKPIEELTSCKDSDILGGLKRGTITIIGGATAVGKTTFLVNAMYNQVKIFNKYKRNSSIMYISYENTTDDLYDIIHRKHMGMTFDYKSTENELHDLEVSSKKDPWLNNIIIIHGDSLEDDICTYIENKINIYKTETTNIDIIYIDYIQLASKISEQREFPQNIITKNIDNLKRIAIEHNICIIIVSGLNTRYHSKKLIDLINSQGEGYYHYIAPHHGHNHIMLSRYDGKEFEIKCIDTKYSNTINNISDPEIITVFVTKNRNGLANTVSYYVHDYVNRDIIAIEAPYGKLYDRDYQVLRPPPPSPYDVI